MPLIGLGQACQYGSSTDASELCDYFRGNSFAADKNAERALEMILDATGSKQEFALKECSGIANALATVYKGVRYILYDKEFMNAISTRTNSWAKISILAHEIGHHIYGHTLSDPSSLAASRQFELEADEYSGFVMYKLGASLSQAQEAIALYSTNKDDTYSTHPTKEKRLRAIENGYNKAKKGANNDYTTNNTTLTAGEYFYKAYNNESDYEYQIYNYTKCLNLKSAYAEDLKPFAYFCRAMTYKKLENYQEAVNDYNSAISLSPSDDFYFQRGKLLQDLGYHKEAIADYSSAIGMDSEYIDAYFCRASMYEKIGQLSNAISDYTTCIKLCDKNVSASNRGILGEASGYYLFRGLAKVTLNNKNWGKSACDDFKKACDLGQEISCKWYFKQCK